MSSIFGHNFRIPRIPLGCCVVTLLLCCFGLFVGFLVFSDRQEKRLIQTELSSQIGATWITQGPYANKYAIAYTPEQFRAHHAFAYCYVPKHASKVYVLHPYDWHTVAAFLSADGKLIGFEILVF